MPEPWNHNIHYTQWVLGQVPKPCYVALDVGCGDGFLAAKLADVCTRVIALEKSPEMILRARNRVAGLPNVQIVEGDFLEYPLEPESFDLVTSVAALHHMPLERAIARVVSCLRPGGVFTVVGLARNAAPGAWGWSPVDYVWAVIGVAFDRFQRVRVKPWDSGAPVRDPDLTYSEIKNRIRPALPGVVFTRRLLFRYTLSWRKPGR